MTYPETTGVVNRVCPACKIDAQHKAVNIRHSYGEVINATCCKCGNVWRVRIKPGRDNFISDEELARRERQAEEERLAAEVERAGVEDNPTPKKVKAIVRKRQPCPVTREEFLYSARPLIIRIGDVAVTAMPRAFSTGSFGWNVNNKAEVYVGDVKLPVQVAMNIIAVNSKGSTK